MISRHFPDWTVSWIGAVAVHGSGLMLIAGLVGQSAPLQRSEFRLDTLAVSQAAPLQEGDAAKAADVQATAAAAVDGAVPVVASDDAQMVGPIESEIVASSSTSTSAGISEDAMVAAAVDHANLSLHQQDDAVAVTALDAPAASATSPVLEESAIAAPATSPAVSATEGVSAVGEETGGAASDEVAVATPDSAPPAMEEAYPATAVPQSPGEDSAATAVHSDRATADEVLSPSSLSDATVLQTQNQAQPVAAPAEASALAVMENTEPAAALPAEDAAPASAAELAMIVPQPAERAPKPPLPDVAGIVRNFSGGPCFIALPVHSLTGRWTVRSYGDASTLEAFDLHMKQAAGVPLVLSPRTLQEAQCQAIDFAKPLIAASSSAFAFDLDAGSVVSGGHVMGTISGFSKRFVNVLLVDDEGIAQDVSSYAQVAGGEISVDIPVHLKGNGSSRTQLLFAITSDKPLTKLDIAAPTPVQTIVEDLRQQMLETRASIEVAVTDFSVK